VRNTLCCLAGLVAQGVVLPACNYEQPIGTVVALPRPSLATEPYFTVQAHAMGHDVGSSHLAYSPDGTMIATVNASVGLQLWSASSGKQIASFERVSRQVSSVAFSQDGRRLVGACEDGKVIRVWSVGSGKEELVLVGHTDKVAGAAFSPDGTRIASASDDGTVRLWDAVTGNLLFTCRGHEGPARAVAFRPDGVFVVSAGADGTLKAWETATGKLQRTQTAHAGGVEAIAFSPDGTLLAGAGNDRTIRCWDGETGEPKTVLRLSNKGLAAGGSLAFSPDSKRLIAGSNGDDATIWDVASGNPVRTLSHRVEQVGFAPLRCCFPIRVAYSPKGTTVATLSGAGTLKVWDASSAWDVTAGAAPTPSPRDPGDTGPRPATTPAPEGLERAFVGHAYTVNDVAFSPDGRRLASVGSDGTAKVWEVASGKLLRTFATSSYATKVAFDRLGTGIVAIDADNRPTIWDAATGAVIFKAGQADGDAVTTLSRDGAVLATVASGEAEGKAVRLRQVSDNALLRVLEGSGAFHDLDFSPDGKHLAAAGDDQSVVQWEVRGAAAPRVLKGHTGAVRAVAYSPDGKHLASGSDDEKVKLWAVDSGAEARTLATGASVMAVAFSPDGTLLTTADDTFKLRVWELSSGKELRTFYGTTAVFSSVTFSPDGAYLASTDRGADILLWRLATP
jgi:WD40 repeat protein